MEIQGFQNKQNRHGAYRHTKMGTGNQSDSIRDINPEKQMLSG